MKSFIKNMLEMYKSYFPNTLNKIYIVNVPFFFYAIFSFFQNFFENDVLERIKILTSGKISELFLDVLLF